MSEQTTAVVAAGTKKPAEYVSDKQKALAVEKFGRLYKSTGSVVLDIAGSFKFLAACSKDEDRTLIHALLDDILNTRADKNKQWKADHPQSGTAA